MIKHRKFLAMAASTSRTYTAEDVLALLDQQEIVDELLSTVDLDTESEDKDCPEAGDFSDLDRNQLLLQPELHASHSSLMISQALSCPQPAERDSVLYLDPDLCDESGRHAVIRN